MAKLEDVVRKGFSARLFDAHADLEKRERRAVSRREIGERVGNALGAEAIGQGTVATWFGGVVPPADVGIAIAKVYGVTAGWLYFNESAELLDERVGTQAEKAPPLPLVPSKSRTEKDAAKRRRRG